jgi:arsenite/tail-anchored protein-transporting ATPase
VIARIDPARPLRRRDSVISPGFLADPTRFLFFTGKGGVGKTSLACAVALALADRGKSVLIVSTDPASNLDEILGAPLTNLPVAVPGAERLLVLNIDPTAAADAYRIRVLDQLGPDASNQLRNTVREQLSGACTTEIAAFDEFAGHLASNEAAYDHVVFDTAPTGHTLRLLSLPKAWSSFLEVNEEGASCLGPHSGLKMQEARFRTALAALSEPATTTIILVARPEVGALAEAARTAAELQTLGLSNQRLVVNGVFWASDRSDATAASLEDQGKRALSDLPAVLQVLPRDDIPLRPFELLGVSALRSLLAPDRAAATTPILTTPPLPLINELPGLDDLIDSLAADGRGLIMVMGKGGVGKTTIAAAIGVGLVQRGHTVHLSTTDPAAHLAITLAEPVPGLRVNRIDPKAETERYVEKIMTDRGRNLDAQGQALLREDLRSPCTEEIAVFHAFSRIVQEARSAFVVLDTAPTGHTLLLMDATGAYHRQVTRQMEHASRGRIITPLMRIQDPTYTHVVLVTLAEATPVSQAYALQGDLRRAHIEPYAWVINKSLLAAGTRDPLLTQRLLGEQKQINRVRGSMAKNVFFLPWQAIPPIGLPALQELARSRHPTVKRRGNG